MAYRDKSQGFGFVYADLKTLLNQREELSKQDQWEPIETPAAAQSVNLNKDAVQPTDSAKEASVEQIKENLDRLAKLHQKLHVMLDEIHRLNQGKKPSDNN